MFSEQLRKEAEMQFQERLPYFGQRKEEILCQMEQCSEEERILMKFLYGTMLLRDVGVYDFKVFYGFVRHALMLREHMDWCRELSEEMFLHDVLYYRINTEQITDCRGFFYDCLKDRIKGLSAEQAVLEVNYWCAEQGTYQSTDGRTISPMTFYNCGNGRCGEESVFTVTALRSVGIPARQVYTPRWAHCDDNHAWVEVYVNGDWHFLGACEPEEVLDKGWFTNASSRAMIVHTRRFSDYGAEKAGYGEDCIGRDGCVRFYNVTSHYAKTRNWKFQVVDTDGNPVECAKISVQLMNMAEHSQVAELWTDEQGIAQIQMGSGSFYLHVEKERVWAEKLVTSGEKTTENESENGDMILVQLSGENQSYSRVENFGEDLDEGKIEYAKPARETDQDIIAPDDFPMHPVTLTAEQKKRRAERVRKCNQIRESRVRNTEQEIDVFLTNRKTGYSQNDPSEKKGVPCVDQGDSSDRQALVRNLSAKDHKDAKAWILEKHLQAAKLYKEVWTDKGLEAIYQKYILSPRIWLEEMTDYRTFILEFFTEDQKIQFQKDPETVWKWIHQNIKEYPELDYSEITGTPEGVLQLMQGTDMSRRILFAAICRTLGIPARINPVNQQAEYWKEGRFAVPGIETEESSCLVTFSFPDSKAPVYYQSWTIGRLEGTDFVTMDLSGISSPTVSLPPGIYRLITTNRLPNGSQFVKETVYVLHRGEEKKIPVYVRELKLDDMRVSNRLDDFELKPNVGEKLDSELEIRANKESVRFSQIAGTHIHILAFLAPGEEPTEHVLNEFLMQKEKWNTWITDPDAVNQSGVDQENTHLGRAIHMILQHPSDLENRTLQKVLQEIPGIQIWYGDFDELVEPLARRMYVDPDKLPLLIVTDPGMTAIYGCSGYNVGSVGLMLELLK